MVDAAALRREEDPMFFLIKAAMAGSMVLAAVPNLNVEPSCRAAASTSPGYASVCRATEQKANDEVARQWPQLSAAEQAECIPAASPGGGNPTYTELLTCLELARDVRQLRGKTPPTTTWQGEK
jgi:hypothetical protein